jgi:hypothetical protein
MAGGYGFDVGAFKQLFTQKTEHATLVKKVNDLNVTLDYMKVGLAVASLGLTVFKADATILKFDEKGATFLGRTIKTWPWAAEGHDWWRKVATKKEVKKFDEALEAAKKDKETVQKLKDGAAKLEEEIGKSRKRIDALEKRDTETRKKVSESPKPAVVQGKRHTAENLRKLEERVNALTRALGN